MPTIPPKKYTQAVPFPEVINLEPIGVVRSPYKERHGTPRQSKLQAAPEEYQPVDATIEFFADKIPPIALHDLDGFDYVWLISFLHLNKHWNPTVRIPRGPKTRHGTLATRAPHRPNPIGLSAARIVKVEGLILTVQGIDLLDGTPILDIKPYVPYCDAFPKARAGYVDQIEKQGIHEPDVEGKNSSWLADSNK